MYYYRFDASTGIWGTENCFYLESEKRLADEETKKLCNEYAYENAESYSYIIEDEFDFEESEEFWEELEDFYLSACCKCTEISKEEYDINY